LQAKLLLCLLLKPLLWHTSIGGIPRAIVAAVGQSALVTTLLLDVQIAYPASDVTFVIMHQIYVIHTVG
jgi:hypothetical protein